MVSWGCGCLTASLKFIIFGSTTSSSAHYFRVCKMLLLVLTERPMTSFAPSHPKPTQTSQIPPKSQELCLITARRLPAEKRAVVASADPPSVQMPPLAGSMRLRNNKIQASVLGS